MEDVEARRQAGKSVDFLGSYEEVLWFVSVKIIGDTSELLEFRRYCESRAFAEDNPRKHITNNISGYLPIKSSQNAGCDSCTVR